MDNAIKIALIFFSRTSGTEAKYKSWFTDYSKNLDTASILVEYAEGELRKSGIPVYHFHEKNQKGSNFGERIANAYQEIFNLGYDQIISVGNDCPDLQNINWQEISLDLSEGKAVLGPDKRGGAYLIGIQKEAFDKEQFKKLSWQKNTLYKELIEFCQNSGSVIELNVKRDINSHHDLLSLFKIRKSLSRALQVLFQLLKACTKLDLQIPPKVQQYHIFKDSPLRAPPVTIH